MMDPEMERLFEFIHWLEQWRVGMEKMINDVQTVANLKRLYGELDEVRGEDGAVIDLDLLFLDILIACALMNEENLQAVIGEEAATRALMMVSLPEEMVPVGGLDG